MHYTDSKRHAHTLNLHIHTHRSTYTFTHTHTHSHLTLTFTVTHIHSCINSFSHTHLHTHSCTHHTPNLCLSTASPIWWLFPALFSLLVLFIFLSHIEHIWRKIYFHPIWKHISPQPWARQISEKALGICGMGREGWGKARIEMGEPQSPEGFLGCCLWNPFWETLNSEWLPLIGVAVAKRFWHPSFLLLSDPRVTLALITSLFCKRIRAF